MSLIIYKLVILSHLFKLFILYCYHMLEFLLFKVRLREQPRDVDCVKSRDGNGDNLLSIDFVAGGGY